MRRILLIAAGICALSVFRSVSAWTEENRPGSDSFQPRAGPWRTPGPDSQPEPGAMVESMIFGLSGPADQERMGRIYAELANVQDPARQQQLQQLLDQRLQSFSAIAEPPMPSPDMMMPPGGMPQGRGPRGYPGSIAVQEDLAAQVETVVVGPQASVDDLRAVDRLVQAIARLEDPVQREELLNRLEQRERDAEQVPAGSNAAAPMPGQIASSSGFTSMITSPNCP